MFGVRPRAVSWILTLMSTACVSACVYDSSDRCDADQRYDPPSGLCVITCDEAANRIPGERGCVACGEHEQAEHGVCNCVQGYRRPGAGAACAAVPEALGAACLKDQDCVDGSFGSCHLLDDGTGYCTSEGCTQSSDCSAGYGCNSKASPAFCQRPPRGAGASCSSDVDCAGTEATFCESFQSRACFVEGCSLTVDDCFPGQECCDLTGPSFGLYKKQICVDRGSCMK